MPLEMTKKSIEDDIPDPEDGESVEAFVERCLDELGDYDPDVAEQACRAKWEETGNGEEMMGFKEYADPGYRADGKKRYPTDTPKLIRQSWHALSHQADAYTAAQLSRIQTRITNAWKVQISAEGPPTDKGMIEMLREVPRQAPAVLYKTHSTEGTGMEFILSDATPDRYGDIVEPTGWQLDNFKNNPICLFGHDNKFPIGKWEDIKAGGKDLRARLTLAPKGTSDRIDEIRNLIDADILRATSVGFRPLESEPLDKDDKWGAKRFTKHELVECSVVAVPANPNALAVAKSLGVSVGTLRTVFGEHADNSTVQRRDFISRGKDADKTGGGKEASLASMPKSPEQQGAKPMLLSKRIQDAEKHALALQDGLDKHLETIDDQAPTDEQMVLTEDLTAKIETAQRHLTNLKAIEAKSATTAVDAGSPDHQRRAVATARAPLGITFKEKKVEPLDLLFRAARVRCMAKTENTDVDVIRHKIYGDDELTRVACDLMLKAATAPAETTVAGWAAELVRTIWAAWMEALYPQSVFPKLSAAGLALTFGANGRIVIPTRSLVPSISGSFVGEGQPIPVRQGAFTSQTLTPKKMAVITTFTKEMQDYSQPAIEGLLRQMMLDDTAISLDTILLDANPATAIRPPGLRSYQSGLTPAAVTPGYVNFVADYKMLYGSLITLTNGNVRSPVMIVNPAQALNLSLIQPPAAAAPLFPFLGMVDSGRVLGVGLIQSATQPAGQVTMVDAADFTTAGEEGVRLEISDQATLHMEDTTPADIVSGPSGTEVIATPVKSMWQTDSLALRLIMRLNFVMRRPVVAWMSGVSW